MFCLSDSSFIFLKKLLIQTKLVQVKKFEIGVEGLSKTITKEIILEERIENKEFSCAQILVKTLEELGVDSVFGYTGAMILPIFDALSKSRIKIIINSNEQSSAFSAAGYSRSTGKVGVAIVTSGPGITNTLTAVADAQGDSIPLIVIAGQVPQNKFGTDAFQHINVESIFSKVAKKVIKINGGENIQELIKEVYFEALNGKPGPIVIDFPFDKQNQKQEYYNKITENIINTNSNKTIINTNSTLQNNVNTNEINVKIVPQNNITNTNSSSNDECKLFFEELKKSKKPILYIGGGLNNIESVNELKKFNSKMQIPVVCTLMGKGIISNNDELHLGMLGMFGNPSANTAIQENDFFFAIGVRWDDRVVDKVGSFGRNAKIAYIDINPKKVFEIKQERNPFLCINADAKNVLEKLNEYIKEHNIRTDFSEWWKRTKQIKESFEYSWNKETNFIQQAQAIFELNKQINEEDIIITGVGNHQMLSAQLISRTHPKTFISSGALGTMGFALPTSIGVQTANPNKKIIVIEGDGGAKMNFGELNTITNYNLPIKIIILNNSMDGMVQNLQDLAYNKNRVATTREKRTDFSKIAKTLGFKHTLKITKKEELKKGISEFLNFKENALLEIITDSEEVVYPKVPQGKSYSEMNLGPFIKQK
ncbi:MAG: Sulfopyruvate decarboxylase subunit beta [archaeon ADurb.Bin336]|nr:MAG: Sulfopyruvate decarboxylase subunit beta [archaeon ADurb.Bin336]